MPERTPPTGGPAARRDRLLDLVLAGMTHSAIARELGVHRTTVYRWVVDPALAEELRELRAARRFAAQESLQDVARKAIRTLEALLDDTACPPAVRLRAACAVLDRAGITPRGSHPGAEQHEAHVSGLETWPTSEAQRRDRERASRELDRAFQGLLSK